MDIARRGLTVTTIALAALLLAGCAEAEAPATSASPTAEPAPSETPVPETGPASLFDADCAGLLSVADATTIVGAPVQLADRMRETGDVAIRQLGGIQCVWADPAATAGAALSLVVLPSRSGGEPVEDYCDPDLGCSFTATAADFDLFGLVRGAVAGEQLLPRAAAAKEAFALAVASQTVAEPYLVEAAWPVPIDCATLDTAGGVGTLIGDPAAEGFSTGGDAEPNAGFYAALRAVGAVTCGWSGESDGINAQILPGGAWIEDEIAATSGAQPTTVPGVDSAVVIGDALHVFDGDNWIVLLGTADEVPLSAETLGTAAAALIADLDARL